MADSCQNSSSDSCHERHEFTHKIQLQLFDGNSFPVDGTQFWVSLTILKEGNKVTIQFPTINFQTGPIATDDVFSSYPGGMIRTTDGFLPENLRPSEPVYRSYLVPSNNGMSLAFSFTQPPPPLPQPPSGYILSVTFFGGIVISCAGTFMNLVPPGAQVMLPTDVSYVVEPTKTLCKNFVISSGASNVTQFSYPWTLFEYRDHETNDAFDGIFAWSWLDNSNLDQTNGVMNVWVAIGRVKHGKLKMRKPVQLTNIPVGTTNFDAVVAINRTDKNNIIVSYGYIGPVTNLCCRAISFDGGKTWPAPYDGITTQPFNGPINVQPTGPYGWGDNRGVSSDKYGNIWYSTTNYIDADFNFINQPMFFISSNQGLTFSLAYLFPSPIVGETAYDFPQYCFGGDGSGGYGLWFSVDYLVFTTPYEDIIPTTGFIPITGLGVYGVGTIEFLNSLINTQEISCVTASEDGRVWTSSYGNIPSLIAPMQIRFKSPGPLDSNYAGPWQYAITDIPEFFSLPFYDSYPNSIGYINSIQTSIYDIQRQALYVLIANPAPDLTQNMRLYFMISRNNGQTWSKPLYISSSNFANRGNPTMALDTKTGDLVFGWYDGRNDPTFQSLQYFGAIMPAAQLDQLVNRIPLSNPLYTLPAATGIVG